MHQVAETVHGPIVSQCAGDHMAAYDVARAEAAAADDGEQFTIKRFALAGAVRRRGERVAMGQAACMSFYKSRRWSTR